MKTVRELAEEVVGREGGYVNDPDDPGGATNYGVTIHTMRNLGLDLDRDGDVDARDVRMLSRDQAVDIFVRHYYERPRINLLPKDVQSSVFDMYVNAGSNAVKILQRVCRKMGQEIAVDGGIGPKTAQACEEVIRSMRINGVRDPGRQFADMYAIARRNYYFAIGDRRAASRKYARTRAGTKGGWIKRAEEFMSERFHMSQEEFNQRVSSWA